MNNLEEKENTIETEKLEKLPFKRIQLALNQIIDVAIPLHVELLKQQNESVSLFKNLNNELQLHSEQVKAIKTIQLLKADLFELERLNLQVREEDEELFNKKIKKATKDAIEILSVFMELHSDIFSPLPESELNTTEPPENFPTLVCKLDEHADETVEENYQSQVVANAELVDIANSKYKLEAWNYIQKELVEIQSLIKQFSKFVFRQKDDVDTIQGNIEQTSRNVYFGACYLKKASDYKAATFPLLGAVIGGVLLGPVGALAGFKIVGSAACVAGGSLIGYKAGVKLKNKKVASNDIEMKALTYLDKSKSQSTPDLSTRTHE